MIPWLEEKDDRKLDTKKLIYIGIALLVVAAVIYTIFSFLSNNNSTTVEHGEQKNEPAYIQVHVAGAVMSPGLYKLEQGARIMDAINAAGGFKEDANQEALNLAKAIEDGEQIIVDSKSQSNTQEQSLSGKININTADSAQLQTLSGVGPSTAQKIIDYRNANGKFKTIDDLKKVSGIGDKTLAKFRDKICV